MNRIQALKQSIAANQVTLANLQSLSRSTLVDDLIETTKEAIESARAHVKDLQRSKIVKRTVDGVEVDLDNGIDADDLNTLLSGISDPAVKESVKQAAQNRVALLKKDATEAIDRAAKQQEQKAEAEAKEAADKQAAEEQAMEQKKLGHLLKKLDAAGDKEEFVRGLPERWQQKIVDTLAAFEQEKQAADIKRAEEELAIEMALLDE